MEPFVQTLTKNGLALTREQTTTLQVNVGLLCNQACRHCHLEAGPNRQEVMSLETVEQVARYARTGSFQTIDITGGAPELNPHLTEMIEMWSTLAPRVMLRSNLTALRGMPSEFVTGVLAARGVVVVASVPSLNAAQVEAQRGRGVWDATLGALSMLNSFGYGRPGAGLELNLVSNPSGAFLPAGQAEAERRFRSELERKWGITFNNLFTLTNVPLGRFRDWLMASGNYQNYMQRLASRFNPCAVSGVMCRRQISVSWDGYLYDCDFHLAAGIHVSGTRTHISKCQAPPALGSSIAVADHCYACTAGSGFT